eukprot:966275_1
MRLFAVIVALSLSARIVLSAEKNERENYRDTIIDGRLNHVESSLAKYQSDPSHTSVLKEAIDDLDGTRKLFPDLETSTMKSGKKYRRLLEQITAFRRSAPANIQETIDKHLDDAEMSLGKFKNTDHPIYYMASAWVHLDDVRKIFDLYPETSKMPSAKKYRRLSKEISDIHESGDYQKRIDRKKKYDALEDIFRRCVGPIILVLAIAMLIWLIWIMMTKRSFQM